MRLILPAIFLIVLATSCATTDDRWIAVDEGFRITMPHSWKKLKVQPIDSHCGTYKSKTIDLEFDEVYGLGYTIENSKRTIEELRKKEKDPKLLKEGEEIWHVDGRIARFWNGKVDPEIYGHRRFTNVADLHVPYEGRRGYLSIYILYKSEEDLSMVERVLKSIEWKHSPTMDK